MAESCSSNMGTGAKTLCVLRGDERNGLLLLNICHDAEPVVCVAVYGLIASCGEGRECPNCEKGNLHANLRSTGSLAEKPSHSSGYMHAQLCESMLKSESLFTFCAKNIFRVLR